jgi:UDP-N-acetylglucosamine 1-carboxyvinyltransferase
MSSFRINGGKSLQGDLFPQGAKNEALQVLCACLLTDETITISNIPEIVDVINLMDILKGLGVEIEKIKPSVYQFKAQSVDLEYLNSHEFQKQRCKNQGVCNDYWAFIGQIRKSFYSTTRRR